MLIVSLNENYFLLTKNHGQAHLQEPARTDRLYLLGHRTLATRTGRLPETGKQKCYAAAWAGALTYTLLTKGRWRLIPLVPFKAHLAIDFSVSCFALAVPAGFSRKKAARKALVAVGMLGLAASLLTDGEENNSRKQRHLFI